MFATIWAWLLAGSPAHYYYALLGLYVLLEYLLGESTKVKSNSTLKLVFTWLAEFFFKLLPAVLQAMATKLAAQAAPDAPKDSGGASGQP